MTRLVCIKNEQVMTTSVAMAESFNRRHDNVINSIEKLISEDVIGALDFKATSYKDKSNRQSKMYLLTERGFLIAMPFIGGSKSKEGQVKLVDEFMRMRDALTERKSIQWQESRVKGKLQRRNETDAISEYLLPLAKEQNPECTYAKRPNIAYTNYSRLIKGVLGADYKDRDELTWQYLNAIESIERLVCVIIKKESDLNTPYKDIYQKCKEHASILVDHLYLDDYQAIELS